MPDTTPLGLPFPLDSDYNGGADAPRAVRELAEALDTFLTDQYRLVSIRYITSGVAFTPTAGVDGLLLKSASEVAALAAVLGLARRTLPGLAAGAQGLCREMDDDDQVPVYRRGWRRGCRFVRKQPRRHGR